MKPVAFGRFARWAPERPREWSARRNDFPTMGPRLKAGRAQPKSPVSTSLVVRATVRPHFSEELHPHAWARSTLVQHVVRRVESVPNRQNQIPFQPCARRSRYSPNRPRAIRRFRNVSAIPCLPVRARGAVRKIEGLAPCCGGPLGVPIAMWHFPFGRDGVPRPSQRTSGPNQWVPNRASVRKAIPHVAPPFRIFHAFRASSGIWSERPSSSPLARMIGTCRKPPAERLRRRPNSHAFPLGDLPWCVPSPPAETRTNVARLDESPRLIVRPSASNSDSGQSIRLGRLGT